MQAVMRSLFLQPTLCVDGLLQLRVCYFDFQFYWTHETQTLKQVQLIDVILPSYNTWLCSFMALWSEVVRWPERLADGRLLKDVADEANTQAEWKWEDAKTFSQMTKMEEMWSFEPIILLYSQWFWGVRRGLWTRTCTSFFFGIRDIPGF